MVLDEFIAHLNQSSKGGTLLSGHRITALAFEDDLLLLQDDDIHVPETLDTVARFCADRGMNLNSIKCVSISATVSCGIRVIRSKPLAVLLE